MHALYHDGSILTVSPCDSVSCELEDSSSCYHHLVIWTETSSCYHHAIIMWLVCVNELGSSTRTSPRSLRRASMHGVSLHRCDTRLTMLNPAYQNPDRRGRVGVAHAGVAHGDKTIEDEKACRSYGYGPFLENPWGSPSTWGETEVASVHVKTINCLRGIVIINLPLPNEDFGRPNRHFRARFRGTFKGCEHQIWATNGRKVLRTRALKCWFILPKSSFGEHTIVGLGVH
jgi:hypothetical protein